MSQYFLSYRRDAALENEIVYRSLAGHFGEHRIVRDVDDIPLGSDFREKIEEAVTQCDVLLAVVDRYWLEDEVGRRRRDEKDDFIRLEIELALEHGIPVVPVLLDKVQMPKPVDLPESLRPLCFKQAAKVRPGRDLDGDLKGLIKEIVRLARHRTDQREELSKIRELWEQGRWSDAHQRLEGAASELRADLAAKPWRSTCRKLSEAEAALTSGRHGQALAALQAIEAGEGPSTLDAARRLAELGTTVETTIRSGEIDRIAELRAEFEELTGTGGDTPVAIPGVGWLENRLGQAAQAAEYARALRQFEAARYSEAREGFLALGEYEDAASYLARCDCWIGFFDSIRERQWKETKEALDSLQELGRSPRIRKWRQWSNKVRRFAPVLEQMAAGRWAPEQRAPWEGGEGPYEILGRTLEITPESPMQACQDLTFDLLQSERGMSAEERSASDALRLVEKRLLVDFALYRIRSPERAEEVLIRLCDAAGGDVDAALDDVSGVAKSLGDDEGIFHALLRDYDQAIVTFLNQAREDPEDATHFHHLGLAAAGKAHAPETDFTEIPETIEKLIIGLGATFADDRFWQSWWAFRRKVYAISGSQVADARFQLQHFWLEQVKSLVDPELALDLAFQVEINGARAVMAGGGILVAGEAEKRVVVGITGARALGILDAVSDWTAGFGSQALDQPGWRERACVYLSVLGPATALFEDGRYDEANRALEQCDADSILDFHEHNPGFSGFRRSELRLRLSRSDLLSRVHQKLALEGLSEFPVDVDQAVEHWREAMAQTSGDRRSAELATQIRSLAVGRASVLKDRKDQPLDGLNDAVRLLQGVLDEGWDGDEEPVRDALVEALLNRAVHLSNQYDAEREARLDAQRAWSMAPQSLRAFKVLSAASLHYARELSMGGDTRLAEAVLQEVEKLLEQGKELFPGDQELAVAARNAEEMKKILAGEGTADLARLLRDLRKTETDAGELRQRDRWAEALVKEAQREFEEAVEIYWELVQAKPEDSGLRGKLAWCYRAWVYHLVTTGADASEIRRIIREGRERCPGSEALTDLAGMDTEDD